MSAPGYDADDESNYNPFDPATMRMVKIFDVLLTRVLKSLGIKRERAIQKLRLMLLQVSSISHSEPLASASGQTSTPVG